MPAKIIVKSGYIKNVQHMANALDYAGNKIEAQLAVMEDGSTVEASAADLIAGEENLARIRVTLKSGRTINLKPEQYRQKVRDLQKPHQEQVLHWEGGEKAFSSEDYIKYIAYRPSVEKAPDRKHGLFTLDGDADMELEKERLKEHQDSVMWSHIISLERPDAERTGYDHRAAWQNLVTAKSMEIAKLYSIDPKNLVVNAAYHNKDHHPHLHLYFYSTDPREGIVRDMQYASARLKSLFFNEIFRDDVSYLKATRTDQRGQLEARLEELLRSIQNQNYRPPKEVCDKLLELSVDLQEYKGKNVYAFHKPQIKAQVDEIVELMVSKDRHLSRLFDAYLATQQEFVEQYQEDPEKITARMEEFREHFFHPRPAQRGKQGTGDRAVLHNEILRYAATLEESVLTLPPKPKKHKSSGTTAKKKQSAEEILNSEVYGALRASVKEGDAPRPLENEVTTLYNEIKDDEFATAYSYVPLDAKAETRGLLRRMADASEPFRNALQAYLQKQQKDSGNPEITLDQLEKKFFDPGWRDNRYLHDTIVRFSKKLEEQRAVINYNSKVFFSLPDTFRENGDKEQLAKLTELNALVAKIPNEDLGFRELEKPLQEKITGMLAGILNSKEEIRIPEEVKQALLHPDDLTPVTFQNTITKFAKKLEQHRAVTEHNHEVYSVLSDSFSEEGSQLLKALEQLHKLAKEVPPEKLSYYQQDIDLRAPANGILTQVFDSGKVHVQEDLQHEFLSPDELTPMGFQNTIFRFAKKLPVHRTVAQLRQEVFSSLLESLNEESTNPVLRGQLAELYDLLADIPNDQLAFRKLDEPVREQVSEILAELLNSKEEIQIPDEVKQDLLHPDELTPLGLQNTILRFAKKPEEHKAVTQYNSAVYFSLSGSLDENGDAKLLAGLEDLHGLLEDVSIGDLNFRKLDDTAKGKVTEMLESILNSKEEIKIPAEVRQALLHPDELTPLGFQNTVLRFAKKLEEHKAIHAYNSDVFFSLSSCLQEDGDPALEKMLETLAGQLQDVPDKELGYRKLDNEKKNAIHEILAYVLDHENEIRLSPELRGALLYPDEFTPLGFQNSILRFSKRLEEHKAVARYNSELYLALSGALKETGNPALRGLLEELHDLLADIPNDQLAFRKLDEPVREQVSEILADLLNSKEKIQISEGIKQALLNPDEQTPLGFQNTILRFGKKLEEHKAIATVRSDLYLLLSKNIGEQTELDARLKALGESLRAVPLPEDLDYRKMNPEQQQAVVEILAKALRGSGLPEQTLDALLHPDELTPLGLQSMVIRFAEQYKQYRLASYLQRDLFMGLLKTTDNKSPLRQELLALQGELRRAGDVSYPELPKEVQEQINILLRKLLKDHPAAKQHSELLAELFSPGKRTPTGLQNTVMRFARRYDEYVKRQIRQKAQYTAKLLLRSCAYALASLARENDRYNNQNRETDPEDRLSGRNHPMQAWRNYREPAYDYD